MRGRMIHDEDGGQQLQPYGNKPEEVIYSVSRGALNTTLMDAAEAAGVTIQFNQRCDGVDLDRNILRLVDEARGETRETSFAVTIGADGSGSAVREAIVAYDRLAPAPLYNSFEDCYRFGVCLKAICRDTG